METSSVSKSGFLLVTKNHVSQGKVSMKKLFSLLLFIPGLALCDSSVVTTKNTFSFTQQISAAAGTNPGWQIFNSSANRKTIYVESIKIGGDTNMFCTFYSTNVASGFTGSQTQATAKPFDIGKGTSISSCTYTGAASAPTGDTLWQSVVLSSTTFCPIEDDSPIAIRPGKALYIIGTKPAAGSVFVNFYFREENAP